MSAEDSEMPLASESFLKGSRKFKERVLKIVNSGSPVPWMITGVATTAALGLGILVLKQWHYAAIGRDVTKQVSHFLEKTGSTIDHGLVIGGMLTSPLPVGRAVLVAISDMMGYVIRRQNKGETGGNATESKAIVAGKAPRSKSTKTKKPGDVKATPVKAPTPEPVANKESTKEEPAKTQGVDAMGRPLGPVRQFPEEPLSCRIPSNASAESFSYTPHSPPVSHPELN